MTTLMERFRADLGASRAPGTIKTYVSIAEHIIAGVGPDLTRPAALAYRDELVREKVSRGHMQNTLIVLRHLARIQDVPCPLTAKDLPGRGIYPQPPVPATMRPETIGKMITAARAADSDLPRYARAYLALSTVYGFRRAELSHIEIGDHRVSVRSLKGGEQRTHTLPDAIWPIVVHTYKADLADSTLSQLYHHIRRAAKLRAGYHDGWHAVRRGLITGLVGAGVDQMKLKAWMGWRAGGEWNPVARYYRPDPAKLDAEMFEHHPFLPLWR